MKALIVKTAAIVAALLYTLPALPVLAQSSSSAHPKESVQSISKGQRYYQKVCAQCHETGIGPVIKGRGFPEATYIVIARNGFNAMPAFRVSDIDDKTLQELATYLANTKPSK